MICTTRLTITCSVLAALTIGSLGFGCGGSNGGPSGVGTGGSGGPGGRGGGGGPAGKGGGGGIGGGGGTSVGIGGGGGTSAGTAGAAGSFACGLLTCTGGEVCLQYPCVDAPPCYMVPDGGCPVGAPFSTSWGLSHGTGCQGPACPTDCVARPASCSDPLTCACLGAGTNGICGNTGTQCTAVSGGTVTCK